MELANSPIAGTICYPARMLKITLAVLLLVPSAPFAQVPESLHPQVPAPLEKPLGSDALQATVHRLSNGLTVYLSPNRQEPRVAAWIAVRAGGAHDPQDSTGMAHYLEHMLFKGSQSLGTLDYAKERPHLDKILELYERLFGVDNAAERARLYKEIDQENIKASGFAIPNELDKAYKQLGFKGINAFTSFEQTVYVANFPANRAEVWAKVETDRFARPVFRLFQSEIETVYEEKNRSMDNAERIIGDAVREKLYGSHPYATSVLGSIEHLKNPSLAKMYAFYRRNYVPSHMAVALAGDFDRSDMLALLERTLGSWKPKAAPKTAEVGLPALAGTQRIEVKYEAEEKVMILWPTVAENHPDADALRMLDMLMDNAAAGIMNLELNQAQKVKESGSYPNFMNGAGSWTVWAVTKQGQTLEQAEALLMETVAKVKAGEFAAEDIRAIITDFEVSDKLRLEGNEGRVSKMVDSFTSYEEWPYSAASLDRLRKVTKEDVMRAAGKYLGDNRIVAFRRNAKPELPTIQKPSFTKIDIDASRQSKFFKEVIETPAQPIEPRWLVEGRDYRISPTPAGRLVASQNPFNDLFAITFYFERGQDHERGLCAAADLWELSGAGSLSAEAYKKKLYGLGTKVSFGCGRESMSVSVSGLDNNLWESLKLLRERFDSPNVAPDTLQKMIEVQIGAHQDNKKEPGYIHHALEEYAQRGKESSVLAELSDPELRSLREDKLKAILKRVYDYGHRTAYVGNRPPEELAKLLESGKARYQPTPSRKPLRYLRPAGHRVLFTHRDMLQAQVGISAADEVYDPEKSVEYQFYSNYMGGGMSAVIFQEIREARSLAYAAGGGYAPGGHKGDENRLYGRLGCQADKTIEATKLLRGLLEKLPPSDGRFQETAKAIEEGYRTNPITFRGAPGAVFAWEDLGITGGDPRPKRFERALRYTLPDLERFAKRFLGRPMTIYVLGHKDRVKLDEMKTLGEFDPKTLEQIFPY